MVEALVGLLAVTGFVAAGLRFAGAAWTAARHAAEAYMARGIEGTRARRGDLTGMAEADSRRRAAGRRRRLALGRLAAWAAVLLVPPLLPWTAEVYAFYNLLWLRPRRPAVAVARTESK